MTNLPENVSGVSTSIEIASESTNIHDISLSVASASDDFELHSCEWSENPRDEDAESLSSANWSREFDSDILDHPEQPLFLEFCHASPDPAKTPRITSTPKKKTDAGGTNTTPLTPLLPTSRFYSQISKVKEKDPLNKACVGESVVSWNFLRVMQTEGCAERCITMVHELSEYDVLSAHSLFDAKTPQEQNQWILEYFMSHCPCDTDGNRDAKNITYILAGRTVCLNIWLRVLAISVSRYYRLRSDFLENGGGISQLQVAKRSRSLSPKTMKAVAWMEHYFNRIGDKRPDKDGIYLPTCLTEKKIYEIMVDELFQGDESKSVCLSQFNKLFRAEFKNVTIPKV